MNDRIRSFLMEDARARFLRYATVHTTSDPLSDEDPSTACQWELLRMLEAECRELGLEDVAVGEAGFVYAALPATAGVQCPDFGLLAHVDTSSEQPGDGVKPRRHEHFDGAPIAFPDDPGLTLGTEDCAELADFTGDTIITASGRTLLGADDKAGIAEILAALAVLSRYGDELPHGRIVACFTKDEEIGRGTRGIDMDRLPAFNYTVDGGYPGELEDECFDAWKATIHFRGVGVHPGYAKDKLVNAATCLARFLAELPEEETPERTEGREGFFYVAAIDGGCEEASTHIIARDFEAGANRERIERLRRMAGDFQRRYPGLAVEVDAAEQYRNMREVLKDHPDVVRRAREAIEDAGLAVIRRPIRGGTDGALLTALGRPTPNIFTGGMLPHSRREWIAESSLAKAAETIVHLARRWTQA